MFDEWNDQRKGEPAEQRGPVNTIDWLSQQYKTEKAYTEKVPLRSRPDYERIMQMICDTLGKSGRRVGEWQIGEVTPGAADKIYEKIIKWPERTQAAAGREGGRTLPRGVAHHVPATPADSPQQRRQAGGDR